MQRFGQVQIGKLANILCRNGVRNANSVALLIQRPHDAAAHTRNNHLFNARLSTTLSPNLPGCRHAEQGRDHSRQHGFFGFFSHHDHLLIFFYPGNDEMAAWSKLGFEAGIFQELGHRNGKPVLP